MALITAAAREEIIALFVGMFKAAPGAANLNSVVTAYEAGATTASIAAALATKAQFAMVYPTNNTSQEFADSLVANLLGTEVSAAATAWSTNWVIAQANAGMTRAQIILTAVQAIRATTNPNYADAKAALANKVEVATYYSVTENQSSTSLVNLQGVIAGVTSDDETVEDAKEAIQGGTPGTTYTLTAGVDTVPGTAANDTITAQSLATVITNFDSIDGGAGTDTLNIYTTGAINNTALPTNASVKNVEVVNVYNSGAASAVAGDASKFAGVQQLWQHVSAVAVTNLAATTTAGFNSIAATALSVTAAAGATSASVALTSVDDASTLTVTGAALTTVNVSGTVVAAVPPAAVKSLAIDVNQSATAATVTVNSAVASTLTFDVGALANVDASGSTGAITYVGAAGVGSIKSGAANDTLTLGTATTASLAAVLDSGAGNDAVTVNVSGTGSTTVTTAAGNDTVVVNVTTTGTGSTTTVDTGAGTDVVTLNTVGAAVTTVNLGADNDRVIVNGVGGIASIKTTDVVDGGAGVDGIRIAGKGFVAEDYILLTQVVKNFETLELTSAGTVDTSQLASYSKFVTLGGTSTFTGVAAAQTLEVSAGVNATAAGYVTGPTKAWGGDLNITATGAGTVTAMANAANLTINAVGNSNGTVQTTAVALAGDLKAATVALVTKTDTNGTTATTDDVFDNASITVSNAATLASMTTLTLTGNGVAFVTNADGKSLVSVDASALASKSFAGAANAGLTYVTTNTASETIKLGSGLDNLTVTGSTFLKSDTITGLSLVDNTALAGIQVDAAKSDDLTVKANDGTTMTTFVKTTTAAVSLDLALVDLAASANDKLVFQFGGDTYIFGDVAANGGAGDNVLTASDVLVKLTGVVDLDLLVSALG